jgi:hypothetical protein
VLALTLAAGLGAAAQADPEDDCHSLSVHGMWDCR